MAIRHFHDPANATTSEVTESEYPELRATIRDGGGEILSSAPVTVTRMGKRVSGYAVLWISA